MKKFVTASFMLELVLCDDYGDKSLVDVSYDLRDRNGQLVSRGSFDDVHQALLTCIETYKKQSDVTNESSKS